MLNKAVLARILNQNVSNSSVYFNSPTSVTSSYIDQGMTIACGATILGLAKPLEMCVDIVNVIGISSSGAGSSYSTMMELELLL